jgi:hypothetical protein
VSTTTNSKQIHSDSKPVVIPKPTQISYASTDEDVDELNSQYSEEIDRSISTNPNPSLFPLNNEHDENNLNSISQSKILSNEYSQITFDSGVDIISEQRIYQPNTALTIDEQSSEELTDQNDLFALSDDSLSEIQPQSPTNDLVLNQSNEFSTSTNKTEQDSYFSAKSDLNYEKDPYSGYELETITDEDDEYQSKNDASNEIILITEPLPPPTPSIPTQFQFKLPTFGEWIDRVFTTFLAEANPNPSKSISSSRSSSSHVITVLENPNVNFPQTQSSLDDEHSLNGKH